MAYRRTALRWFALANPAYVSATVTFYTVDPTTRERTDTLATLYQAQTGTVQLTNPQVLTSEGRSQGPIYVEEPVIGVVTGATSGDLETGVFEPASGTFRGDWAAATLYYEGDVIRDGAAGVNTGNLYVATEVNTSTSSFSDDLSAGLWTLILDVTVVDAARDDAEDAAAAAATSATTATNAAQAVSGAGLAFRYAFSTTTTDADPGAGIFRLNNATQSSATELYVSDTDGDSVDVSAAIATFDDSTSAIKGFITLRKRSEPAKFLIFSLSALTDATGYTKLSLSHVAGSAASPFADGEVLVLGFTRTGDKGETGAGDVTGPASSTDDAIARFDGAGGKTLQNGVVRITDGGAVYGASDRVNNIGSTGSTVTCDFSAYNVWIFEPTGNLTVNVTNIPALTVGAVIGYMIVTGGGDHTLTFTAEGGSGTVLTEGGSGLVLGTSTQVDIVGILQTGTDTIWLKVLNAEALS